MRGPIGIRREEDPHERRSPLSPGQILTLVRERGVRVLVEDAPQRVFAPADFESAGARMVEDLSECHLILGVKEVPIEKLVPGRPHCFFSHTIKGQPYNMPMLRAILERRVTLLDYERVTDPVGRRLIFFGPFAGYAGMVDTLWALGRRLEGRGIDTPLSRVRRALHYGGLDEAKAEIQVLGEEIARDGLPESLAPLVVGFAGYGNVSQGAQEVFDRLPFREIAPAELASLAASGAHSNRVLYKVVFKEEDMVRPRGEGKGFELQDYYDHPASYEGIFESYLPHLTALVNCIYWERRYPRLVTKKWLRGRYEAGGEQKLQVIGDISCDVGGSVECTLEVTSIERPIYVYEPLAESVRYGSAGEGPVVLALDRLPTEFPREATETFGRALLPFVPDLARADFSVPFEQLDLPPAFRRSIITHLGELAPDYRYLDDYLRR